LRANDPFALLSRQLQHAGALAIERATQEIARDAIVATKELEALALDVADIGDPWPSTSRT
jgi:hypothetical protein